MYLSIITSIFGILFILAGIAGFIPGFYDPSNDLLFGIFQVDIIHSIANFVIGIIALLSALKYKSDRRFLQIFGFLFGILAIAGFVWQGDLYFTETNMADNILHLVIAIIFLYLAYSANKEGSV